MIKKLRGKFILLTMCTTFCLLAVMLLGMNLLNYRTVVKDADEILSFLVEHKGRFPNFGENENAPLPPHMSPELPYESRYFSIQLDGKGELISVETSKIVSVDREEAVCFAEEVLAKGKKRGFIGEYRYRVRYDERSVMIVFLDHGRKLDSCKKFLFTSLTIATIGFVLVGLVVFFFAGRFIRPVAESYEKQKRFITDAGHEIKTPLTIINANVDLLEMELGKNEGLDEVRLQSERLTSLTNNLVSLARMEETDRKLNVIEFPISEATEEAVASFKAPAAANEKMLSACITPMLTVKGDLKAYTQMVNILLDNAMKYSPKGGSITVTLEKHGRGVLLTVENDTVTEIDPKSFERIFDRFYRVDPSRNSETGGHGIGLSLAQAVVHAHGGRITPFSRKPYSFGINVFLPL